MNKWIRRSLYVAPFLLIAGLARSDYTATQGAGTTVFAFVCSVSKVCPASVLINSSNVEIATAGAPLRVDPTGTTTQPISAASLPLPATASTSTLQTTGNTSLATIATNSALATPAGTNIIGKVGIDQTTFSVTNGVVNAAANYNTVAASQTTQALTGGGGGATGDYLSHCVVMPTSTSPGVVTIIDNATTIFPFAGGASSLSNLVPFTIPIGALSKSGAWKVTTGTGLSVTCVGKFT